MPTKSEVQPMIVGETRFLEIEIFDDAGDPANPDSQAFRKSGVGITGVQVDTNPSPTPAPSAGDGKFRVAVTATAGPGTIRWDWKGSGSTLQPFAVEGFIKVLRPGLAP